MKIILFASALAAFSTGAIFAQEAVVTAPAKKPAVIAKRKEVQQKRIANGVQNGSLTPKETAKLETRETRNNQVIAAERSANGGTLTADQKRQAVRRQNSISRDITKEKHDAQTQK